MMQQKHFTIENAKNCDVSATVQQIATKFNVTTLNVSLKYTAVKKLNFNIPRWRTAAILKIEKLQYHDDAERVSSVSAVHSLGSLKLNF